MYVFYRISWVLVDKVRTGGRNGGPGSSADEGSLQTKPK